MYATRASTLAARLRAIYGSVDDVDAFVGMMSEPHVPGTEFGELQLALWKKQFEALRDGDRFFYLADPALEEIQRRYGISYRHTLAQLIALNTDVPRSSLPPTCSSRPRRARRPRNEPIPIAAGRVPGESGLTGAAGSGRRVSTRDLALRSQSRTSGSVDLGDPKEWSELIDAVKASTRRALIRRARARGSRRGAGRS